MERELTRDEMLTEWSSTKAKLTQLRARELELRAAIIDDVCPVRTEGTNRTDLGHGYQALVKQPISRKLHEDVYLSKLETLDAATAGRVVTTKLVLNVAAFKELDGDDLAPWHDIIEEKPGTATLDIVAAKKRK